MIVLSTTSKYYHPRLFREATELNRHRNNMNIEDEGLRFNWVWLPGLRSARYKKLTSSEAQITLIWTFY